MGVLWVKAEWQDRGGDSSGFLEQSDTLSWLIRTDDKTMQRQAVYLAAAGVLPARFDVHPGDALGILTARRIQLRNLADSPYLWRATVTYSSQPLTQDEQDKEEFDDPLDRPPVIRVRRESFEEPVTEDLDGDAILNSAKDPYPDPLVKPRSRKVFEVTYNAAAIPAWHDSLEGKVNDANVTISKGGSSTVYPARTLLFAPGDISELKDEGGVEYMEVSFSLVHRRETWRRKLLDEGFHYLDAGTKRKITIEDADGNPVEPTDPQLLDGAGGVLAAPSPSTAVFNEFDIDEEGDFSVLPLDDT